MRLLNMTIYEKILKNDGNKKKSPKIIISFFSNFLKNFYVNWYIFKNTAKFHDVTWHGYWVSWSYMSTPSPSDRPKYTHILSIHLHYNSLEINKLYKITCHSPPHKLFISVFTDLSQDFYQQHYKLWPFKSEVSMDTCKHAQ